MEMEKLELKHIAPYLPYELKYARVRVSPVSLSEEIELIGVLSTNGNAHNINKNVLCDYTSMRYFPILRPLSYIKQFEDIMDEFSEYSWETFENHFFVLGRSLNCFDSINYTIAELCFKHHLDLFGLIDKGLAISHSDLL